MRPVLVKLRQTLAQSGTGHFTWPVVHT